MFFCCLLMYSDFCVGFLTRSVSVTCIFSYMNLLQHIKYYQFLYVLAPHNNIHFCFTTLVPSAFHSYWSHVFHHPLYNGLVLSSSAFSVVPRRPVPCMAVRPSVSIPLSLSLCLCAVSAAVMGGKREFDSMCQFDHLFFTSLWSRRWI